MLSKPARGKTLLALRHGDPGASPASPRPACHPLRARQGRPPTAALAPAGSAGWALSGAFQAWLHLESSGDPEGQKPQATLQTDSVGIAGRGTQVPHYV